MLCLPRFSTFVTRAARLADLDYDLRVAVDATRRVVPSLLAGEIDLAVLNSSGERSDLTYVPLLLDEVVLVVPADHPRVYGGGRMGSLGARTLDGRAVPCAQPAGSGAHRPTGLLRQWRGAFRNADPRAADFSRLARALAQEVKQIVTAGGWQRGSQRRKPA